MPSAPVAPPSVWRRRVQVVLPHGLTALLFVALALWLTFPLVLTPHSHVVGGGPGDNLCFLWNTWWFRRQLLEQASLGFWSDAIFAPQGTSLVLHTHTFLQAAISAVVLPWARATVAHNVMLLIGLAANGWAVYALCFHYSRRVVASLAGGLTFAWCAYVSVHLLGHVNLVHAWVIALFALALGRFMERPSTRRAVMVGGALAAAAYSDYYHALYCVIFLLITLLSSSLTLGFTRRHGAWRRAALTSLTLAAVLTLCGVVVAASGGTEVTLGSIRISIRSTRNIVAAVGLLLLAAASMRYAVQRSWVWRVGTPRPSRQQWLAGAAIAGVLLAPLAYSAVELFLRGDYVSPRELWRSSPSGIDASTLVLGPPGHLVSGHWTQDAYERFGIDVIEQSGWLGVLPVLATCLAVRYARHRPDVRLWLLTAATFFVLSLGPFLRVCGADTGLPLPYALLRHVPIFSNARMPGRAIVMVQLAVAVMTAIVLARLRTSNAVAGAWTLALLVETLPTPTPLYLLPIPDAVDVALRDATERGAVLEVPTGLRDSFGERGHLDHRLLAHQLVHERPVVGGFVARLSPSIINRYAHSHVLSSALEISSSGPQQQLGLFTAAEARSEGLAYLVVNRDSGANSSALSRSTLESAGFRFVTSAGNRELYRTR